MRPPVRAALTAAAAANYRDLAPSRPAVSLRPRPVPLVPSATHLDSHQTEDWPTSMLSA